MNPNLFAPYLIHTIRYVELGTLFCYPYYYYYYYHYYYYYYFYYYYYKKVSFGKLNEWTKLERVRLTGLKDWITYSSRTDRLG